MKKAETGCLFMVLMLVFYCSLYCDWTTYFLKTLFLPLFSQYGETNFRKQNLSSTTYIIQEGFEELTARILS